MKKSVKKINNQKQKFLKTLGIIMFAFLCFQISNIYASNGTLPPKIIKSSSNVTSRNPLFNELMAILKAHQCLSVTVSGISLKDKSSFTSYGAGELSLSNKNNYTLTAPHIRTELSDRRNFQGATTRETIDIFNRSGNTIGVTVKMETWGNRTIWLRNVEITKRYNRYFISGIVTDGNRTVYYVIGLYKATCLI